VRRPKIAVLTGVFGFLALQMGLAFAVERWLPQFRDPEYGRRLSILKARLASAPERPFVFVMLGSSRAMNGFIPKPVEAELERCAKRPVVAFNFGITGGGPLTESLTLRRLLAQGIRPDLVCLEVHPAILHAEHTGLELTRHLAHNRLWLEDLPLLARYSGNTRQVAWAWLHDALVPCFTQRYGILSHLAPGFIPYEQRLDWVFRLDQWGWVDNYGARATESVRQRARLSAQRDYQSTVSRLHPGGLSCQTLRDLLELCAGEKIPAVLLLMPEGPIFRSWYSALARSEVESFLCELHRQYGTPVVNAHEWIGEDDFFDSHHLLASGAEVFSQRLAKSLSPLVQDPSAREPQTAGLSYVRPLD
jgi:hypothetical protein